MRIGKQLKERKATEPLNERLEWDRDGQYFHYLTKWMHALNRVTRATGEFTYNRWAVELARVAHARFVYAPSAGRQKRMYWKMSTDLSYPLVQSMGLHDPLDGLITYTQLAATAAGDPEGPADLGTEIADMAGMCKGRSWVTDDPLGIGGLLSDALSRGPVDDVRLFLAVRPACHSAGSRPSGLEALDREQMKLPADRPSGLPRARSVDRIAGTSETFGPDRAELSRFFMKNTTWTTG